MQQTVRPGQTSTSYPNGAVVTTFDPPPTGFDPLTADPTELWHHGFPHRPTDPESLEHWKTLVGGGSNVIKPTITRRPAPRRLPEFVEGQQTSSNWSGDVVFNRKSGALFTVTGRWKVPHIKPFASGDDRNVSVWVGIDGVPPTMDLLQAGIHAEIDPGEEDPNVWAWVEWFPDDENQISLPVAVGEVMTCTITTDADCLPGRPIHHGQWQSIGDGHVLVPMVDGKVLDWVPSSGHWRLFNYDPSNPQSCIPAPAVSHGQWQSIGDGHVLVPMVDGKVLDWVPSSGHWRLFNYDPSNPQSCIPAPAVSHGQWQSIGDGHVLVPMVDGKVLDWVPSSGHWRLFNYDPSNPQSCIPAPAVSHGQWQSIGDGHVLVPMHDGHVLDWVSDGSWRLFNYDPSNTQSCIPAPAVAAGHWASIDGDHTLVPMQDDRMLDWTSGGAWRLWNYDAEGRSNVSATIVLRNETQHLQAHVRLQAPRRTFVTGNSAEWIVERPAIGTGNPPLFSTLADYGTVQFTEAHAGSIDGQTIDPTSGTTFDMTESGSTVSTGTAAAGTVTCTFV